MIMAGTVTVERAAARLWDAAVIGAGPAGSVAARELARRGLAVLLIDRATFPRRKVCGGCLNASARATLSALGLDRLPEALRAVELQTMRLATRRWRADIPLPASVSVSREALDAALVQHAVEAGAEFLQGTTAHVLPLQGSLRHLALHQGGRISRTQARVIIASDGLSGHSLRDESRIAQSVRPHSHVGVGTVVDSAPDAYRRGAVVMACGTHGYVGAVHLEDGRLNIAAALDPVAIHRMGGPAAVVADVLDQAGLPAIPELAGHEWHGTPPLTQRRWPVASTRLFVLGDAASYVEPFTGEGIAWAVASAAAVAPLAADAVRRWQPGMAEGWNARYRRLIGRRQRACRVVAAGLRHAGVTQFATRAVGLALPLMHLANRTSVRCGSRSPQEAVKCAS